MGDWVEYRAEDGTPYYYNQATGASSWDKPDELKTDAEKQSNESLFWVPDDVDGFKVALFQRQMHDGSWDMECEGRRVNIKKPALHAVGRRDVIMEDLVQLDLVNEPAILHQLSARFEKNHIYTNVGTILVSVNPFKSLPLYTPAITTKYWYRGAREMPPHVYLIADAAFRSLLGGGKNQSILISGESGAGKTEATKQVLQYIAEVAGSQTGVEQNILHANPILEAFGNAKTLRNNNSSRFGKWIEVMFDARNQVAGARITNYLLEKSRLVHQLDGERNYHIFYFMCAGCSPEQKKKYHLEAPVESFAYLNGPSAHIDGVDDKEEFNQMTLSMKQLEFTEEEMDNVFRTTAACLHLGNIRFQESGQGSSIANPEELHIAASLLGVPEDRLKHNLLFRKFQVRGQEPTDVPLNPVKATDNCGALAKKIYDFQFNWLVQRINQSMVPPAHVRCRMIGVLDIFGFEIFQTNSFEQLCINYTNEKLQQLFNQHTFKLEEDLYKREGIKFDHVEFIDNQPVLDLIERKREGILDMLDEEARMPRGSDQTLIAKLHSTHEKEPKMSKNIKNPDSFIIHHYAGEVQYDINGFLDKNKDEITEDLMVLLESSQQPFVRTLFPSGQGSDSKERKRSLGSQFRQQLTDLMATLYSTDQHFIRCIKPNSAKVAQLFEGHMVLQQLRYSGVFEAVRIRKTGFPFRYLHKVFYQRYKLLVLPKGLPHFPNNYSEYCKKLVDTVKTLPGGEGIDVADLQIGKTMMLYRAGPYRILELMRNIALGTVSLRLQRLARGWVVRKQMILIRRVRPVLKQAIGSRVEASLVSALEQASEITIAEIDEVKQARKVLLQVREEKVLHKQIEDLLRLDPEEAFDGLSVVVQRADEIELSTALIQRAREEVQKIVERRTCKSDLKRGVQEQLLELLQDAMARARKLMMASCPEAKAAKEWIALLEKEMEHVRAIQAGMNDGRLVTVLDHSTLSTTKLEGALATAAQVQAQGIHLKNALVEGQLLVQVRKWLLAEDYKQVEKTLGELLKMQADQQSEEVGVIKEELALKCARDEVEEKLELAVQAFDLETLDLGTSQALSLNMTPEEFPVVGVANELKEQLRECKRLLLKGTKDVLEAELRSGVEIADHIRFNHEEVVVARELLANVVETRTHMEVALEMCDPEMMQQWLDRAQSLAYRGTEVLRAVELLTNTPKDKFLQMQYDAAKRLGLLERQIEATVELKQIIFTQFQGMFELGNFGPLRSKDEYASHAWIKKEKARDEFLKYQKGGLLTSLTRIQDPQIVKMAKDAFKSVQGYMGDRQYPDTGALAEELITLCVKVDALRDEVLVQVMKQLTENPNPESCSKGWELLFFLLHSFPPSDDICNYLVVFVRKVPEHAALEHCIHEANFRPVQDIIPGQQEMRAARDQAYSPVAAQTRVAKKTERRNKFVAMRLAEIDGNVPTRPSLSAGGDLARKASRQDGAAQAQRGLRASIQDRAQDIIPEEVQSNLGIAKPKPKSKPPPPPPPPAAKKEPLARCMYEYSGDEGHLCMVPGDVIVVVDKHESGWWTGEMQNKRGVLGVFPGNYVEEI